MGRVDRMTRSSPPLPVPSGIDRTDTFVEQRLPDVLIESRRIQKSALMFRAVKNIGQAQQIQGRRQIPECGQILDKEIEKAVFQHGGLPGLGTQQGGLERHQRKPAPGAAPDLIGKPGKPPAFGSGHGGHGAQDPGDFLVFLKQIAQGPSQDLAQTGERGNGQGRLAGFNLGELALGQSGLPGQFNGRDARRNPQFPYFCADPFLNGLFRIINHYKLV